VQRKPVSQLACKQHFQNVGGDINGYAQAKYHHALIYGKLGKGGRSTHPQQYDAGIKRIDKKSAGEYLHHVALAEADHIAVRIHAQRHLLEEKIKNAQSHKKNTAEEPDNACIIFYACTDGGKYISDYHQYNIAYPYACHEAEATGVAIDETLFYNGKYDRPHAKGKDTSKGQPAYYGFEHACIP
jgi:hypothetical protein